MAYQNSLRDADALTDRIGQNSHGSYKVLPGMSDKAVCCTVHRHGHGTVPAAILSRAVAKSSREKIDALPRNLSQQRAVPCSH